MRLLARAKLPPLALAPGNADVPRGSPLTVTLSAPGRSQATLRWHTAGDIPRAQTVIVTDGAATFEFPAVDNAIEYSATTLDGAATEPYRLTPVDPLLVSDVTLELAFPAHTGREPEEYEGLRLVPEGRLPDLIDDVGHQALRFFRGADQGGGESLCEIREHPLPGVVAVGGPGQSARTVRDAGHPSFSAPITELPAHSVAGRLWPLGL